MSSLPSGDKVTPWYKQFWPWFIISVPLSSVLVAVVQVYAALHSSSDLVKDDYYKEGLAIKHSNVAIDCSMEWQESGRGLGIVMSIVDDIDVMHRSEMNTCIRSDTAYRDTFVFVVIGNIIV